MKFAQKIYMKVFEKQANVHNFDLMKQTIWKFKDKENSKIITNFVCLRPKSFSYCAEKSVKNFLKRK